MATDDRGARILSDLNAAFKKDPRIDEYDVIPILEPKHNKSPLVLVEHKLGLELWSVKILYEYSYTSLMSWRKMLAFKNLQMGAENLLGLSRAVVLVNPECATAWNIRKELIQSGDLSIEEDLKLGGLVFTKHPKSPETFSHRKWLLTRLMKHLDRGLVHKAGSHMNGGPRNGHICVESIDIVVGSDIMNHRVNHGNLDPALDEGRVLTHELRVCEAAASRYPSNYNAWSHRIWVVQTCYKCSVQVLLKEFSHTKGWVSSHVSDHSGFHYRQFLLSQLGEKRSSLESEVAGSLGDLVSSEMKFTTDLIAHYPGHEALWYHRKYVFFTLHKYNQSRCVSSQIKASSCANGRSENGHNSDGESGHGCSLKKTRLENDAHIMCVKEVDSVCQTEMLSSDARQTALAGRYVEWIKKVYL